MQESSPNEDHVNVIVEEIDDNSLEHTNFNKGTFVNNDSPREKQTRSKWNIDSAKKDMLLVIGFDD